MSAVLSVDVFCFLYTLRTERASFVCDYLDGLQSSCRMARWHHWYVNNRMHHPQERTMLNITIATVEENNNKKRTFRMVAFSSIPFLLAPDQHQMATIELFIMRICLLSVSRAEDYMTRAKRGCYRQETTKAHTLCVVHDSCLGMLQPHILFSSLCLLYMRIAGVVAFVCLLCCHFYLSVSLFFSLFHFGF